MEPCRGGVLFHQDFRRPDAPRRNRIVGTAIHLGRHYENSEYSRAGFIYDLERLTAQTHPVTELWDPEDPKGP